MFKYLVPILSLAIVTPAVAESPPGFANIGADNAGSVYHMSIADFQAVQRNGQRGLIWIYVDHRADPTADEASSTVQISVNCPAKTLGITRSITHDFNSQAIAEPLFDVSEEKVTAPGTVADYLRYWACGSWLRSTE